MNQTRTEWSDKRLDDLKESVVGVQGSIERLDGRVDKLQHVMVTGFLSLAALIVAVAGAMIALH